MNKAQIKQNQVKGCDHTLEFLGDKVFVCDKCNSYFTLYEWEFGMIWRRILFHNRRKGE